jgi:hypothetical protein
MLTTCGVRVIEGHYDYLIGHRQGATRNGGGWVDTGGAVGFLPDLTDSATLGCLLALVREAWGDPYLTLDIVYVEDHCVWACYSCEGIAHAYGDTESDALVAALESADKALLAIELLAHDAKEGEP